MSEERRGASLETVLVEIGYIKGKLDELARGQKEQNGRVKKLEIWRAAVLGMTAVIVIMLLPIFTRVAGEFLVNGYKQGLHQDTERFSRDDGKLFQSQVAYGETDPKRKD